MPVFKLCMKILKKNLPQMLIYIVVLLGVSITMSSVTAKDQTKVSSFTLEKSKIAFISEETNPLIDGLKNELGKIADFVELPDKKEALQDALFYRTVSYIVRIPKGFTESFMNGEDTQVIKTTVPNSSSNTYIDLCINKYFKTARLYVSQMSGISQESLVEHVAFDLNTSTPVELQEKERTPLNFTYENFYFNYFSYSLLFVIILGMTALMLVFDDPDLKRRNACSPLKTMSINLQFISANVLFALGTWLIMVVFYFILNRNSFTLNTVYFILNSFVFAICCSSISFLIGNLVKNRLAIPAISNVLTLGTCFMSGVFVPQQFIGASVLKIASFTPTYWFVSANNMISELTQYDFSHVRTILSYILIEAGFALALFAVTLVIRKKKRYSY